MVWNFRARSIQRVVEFLYFFCLNHFLWGAYIYDYDFAAWFSNLRQVILQLIFLNFIIPSLNILLTIKPVSSLLPFSSIEHGVQILPLPLQFLPFSFSLTLSVCTQFLPIAWLTIVVVVFSTCYCESFQLRIQLIVSCRSLTDGSFISPSARLPLCFENVQLHKSWSPH